MKNLISYRYWDVIVVAFVAVVLISNIVSTKIISFGWLTFDGGTLLFPLSYIFGDIFTEVYGYARARRAIWLGFAAAFVMSAMIILIGRLPAAGGWDNQSAYDTILGFTPRLVLASLIAYWAGNFSNSYILAKLKIKTNGRMLWLRTIGSTLVGECIDSTLFILVAFTGVVPGVVLFALVYSNYFFKVAVEVLFTPVTYKIVKILKRAEAADVFDRDTNFNPFHS